ncbi:hypothetical protein FB567DRAFT_607415 [Paraphoma chrysanthemicola]|uniref:Uncharacterized protein n=1 Tax=Paraphoma chrysanthemicola TaxID=798071 RepID=A0A8K0QZU7_9PLEO|nr:hypothetical protein FB567DRAFT_607415 [Paraphoma chrysanthemicola]
MLRDLRPDVKGLISQSFWVLIDNIESSLSCEEGQKAQGIGGRFICSPKCRRTCHRLLDALHNPYINHHSAPNRLKYWRSSQSVGEVHIWDSLPMASRCDAGVAGRVDRHRDRLSKSSRTASGMAHRCGPGSTTSHKAIVASSQMIRTQCFARPVGRAALPSPSDNGYDQTASKPTASPGPWSASVISLTQIMETAVIENDARGVI